MSAISQEVRREMLEADIDRAGPEARALFDRLVLQEGQDAEFAAMCALQQAPGSRNTDRAFCQGQRAKMDGMSPLVGGMLHKTAQRAGINTRGKYYMSGLGKATDPAAWVTCADDVLTVCKAKNMTCEGVINHKAIEKEQVPRKSVGVAPDIVRQLARKRLAQDPALAEKCRKSKQARIELQQQIIETHGRQPKRAKRRGLLSK